MATAAPYVTPVQLLNMPFGIAWSTLPGPRTTAQQQFAQQFEICVAATATVDGICNQILRATVDQEELLGPNDRLTVDSHTGIGYFQTSRWPVREVLGGQVSAAATFPPQWTLIPANGTRAYQELTSLYSATTIGPSGAGSTRVEIQPGFVTWYPGRQGTRCQVFYVNGWIHAGLTASCASGASVLQVDDVTGMLGAIDFVGATNLYISDGANSEYVSVSTASASAPITTPNGIVVQAGPGTITLAAPTLYTHAVATTLSELPQSITWATGLLAAAEALTRGATATVVPAQPGAQAAQGKGIGDYRTEADNVLAPYKRII